MVFIVLLNKKYVFMGMVIESSRESIGGLIVF